MLPWTDGASAFPTAPSFLLVLRGQRRFAVVEQPSGLWRALAWNTTGSRAGWPWVSIGPKWTTAEGAMNWVETTQISDLELFGSVAEENPKQRVFTPSYEAKSKEEYQRKVEDGMKRDLHVMVEGGRTGVRYGETPEYQTTKTREVRRERWADQTQPWSARTQALAAHEVSHLPPDQRGGGFLSPEGPVVAVEQAIKRYRQTSPGGALGFTVPDTPWPLIDAGMPTREARLLTERAPRAFYPDVPSQGVAELTKPSIATDVTRALKRPLQLQWDGRLVVSLPKRRRGATLERVLLYGPQRQVIPVLNAAQIEQGYQVYRAKVKAEGRNYRRETDDPGFLEGFYRALQDVIRTTARATGSEDLTLVFVLSSEGSQIVRSFSAGEHSKSTAAPEATSRVKYKNLQNVNLADLPALLVSLAHRKKRKGRRLQPLSARTNPDVTTDNQLEAFILSEQEAGRLVPVPGKPGRVYWFSQRRKQLTETTNARAQQWLRIADAGRANREGLSRAALPASQAIPPAHQITDISHTSRENPMPYDDEDFWFQQYQTAPYGARRAIPAARRNPWYPGTPSLYLPDTTQTVSAVVPAPYDDYQDLTQRRSALVPGPYARPNMAGMPRRRADLKAELRMMGVPESALDKKSVSQLEDMLGMPVLPKAPRKGKRRASRAAPASHRPKGFKSAQGGNNDIEKILSAYGISLYKYMGSLNGNSVVVGFDGNTYSVWEVDTYALVAFDRKQNIKSQPTAELAAENILSGGQTTFRAKRKARARSNGGVMIAKNGQPYVRLADGKTRFISKDEAAAMGVPAKAMNNPRRGRSVTGTQHRAGRTGPIGYRRGQFGVNETGGFQPVNRRNPGLTPAQRQAKAAMDLYHSGRASSLKEAWRIVKGQAKANGRRRKKR